MACQESADFTNVFNFHYKIELLVMNKLYVLSKLSQLTMDGFASNWDEKKALIEEINCVVLCDFLTWLNGS